MALRQIIKSFLKLKDLLYFIINKWTIKLKYTHVKLGKNVRIKNRVYFQGKGLVQIGDNFTYVSGDCLNPIQRNLRGSFFIEKGGKIIIGENVGISSSCIWVQNELRIGNNVNIGADCLIIDNDSHSIDYMERRRKSREAILNAPIEISDDVWIGAKCIILKGVKIGARSVIGAGSVVTKDIPEDVIAAGNPCKIVKRIIENA